MVIDPVWRLGNNPTPIWPTQEEPAVVIDPVWRLGNNQIGCPRGWTDDCINVAARAYLNAIALDKRISFKNKTMLKSGFTDNEIKLTRNAHGNLENLNHNRLKHTVV